MNKWRLTFNNQRGRRKNGGPRKGANNFNLSPAGTIGNSPQIYLWVV